MDWSSSGVSAYRRYLGMKLQWELIRSLSLLLATSFRKSRFPGAITEYQIWFRHDADMLEKSVSSLPSISFMNPVLANGAGSSHVCMLLADQSGNFLLEELVYGVNIARWFGESERLKKSRLYADILWELLTSHNGTKIQALSSF